MGVGTATSSPTLAKPFLLGPELRTLGEKAFCLVISQNFFLVSSPGTHLSGLLMIYLEVSVHLTRGLCTLCLDTFFCVLLNLLKVEVQIGSTFSKLQMSLGPTFTLSQWLQVWILCKRSLFIFD